MDILLGVTQSAVKAQLFELFDSLYIKIEKGKRGRTRNSRQVLFNIGAIIYYDCNNPDHTAHMIHFKLTATFTRANFFLFIGQQTQKFSLLAIESSNDFWPNVEISRVKSQSETKGKRI